MRSLIKWQEKWFFELTNHQVEQLQMTEWFNQNHIWKILYGHIEVYKNIISLLLENENR